MWWPPAQVQAWSWVKLAQKNALGQTNLLALAATTTASREEASQQRMDNVRRPRAAAAGVFDVAAHCN